MGLTTLCYIEKDSSYLMMHRVKKEKDVNKDKWIGVGGHFEEGESPEECLLREVNEETGLTLNSFCFHGIVTFVSDQGNGVVEYMCLYSSKDFSGELTSCDEGNLEWVKKDELHKLNLWEGDYIFLRLMQESHSFFSLKLEYQDMKLVSAKLDGKDLMLDGRK